MESMEVKERKKKERERKRKGESVSVKDSNFFSKISIQFKI
jgi:hypothetical protein